MSRRNLVPIVVGAAALLVVACAGATKQDVFDKDGPSADPGTSSGTSGTSSGTSGTSGSVVDGGTTDSGAVCPPEVEPNDEKPTANLLAGSVCGAIDGSSDDAVDYFTFFLKPATKSLRMTYSGKVSVRVDVQGYSIVLGSGSEVPFVQGARYYVQVKADNSGSGGSAKTVPYRVDVIEK